MMKMSLTLILLNLALNQVKRRLLLMRSILLHNIYIWCQTTSSSKLFSSKLFLLLFFGILIMHHLSGATWHRLHHGAWIEGVRANHRFTRFVIPCENQAWPADNGLFEDLICLLVWGIELWSIYILPRSAQKILQRHARKGDCIFENVEPGS